MVGGKEGARRVKGNYGMSLYIDRMMDTGR